MGLPIIAPGACGVVVGEEGRLRFVTIRYFRSPGYHLRIRLYPVMLTSKVRSRK